MNKITVAILQPSYIPWLGYFDQIDFADEFIFYDDVQYTKNDWRNRNKIKGHNIPIWLTIPIQFNFGDKINEVKIDENKNWREKHLKTLQQYYGKSEYFNEIYQIFAKSIKLKNLVNINIEFIKGVCDYLSIKTNFHLSSNLKIHGDKNKRLLNICDFFNATCYISGYSAKNYLDLNMFKDKIEVRFQRYKHPVYRQAGDKFIPYLSVLDLLFHYGKNSLDIIQSGRCYE